MAIDLLNEEILSLGNATKRLPRLRNDRPVHVSTLWRWALSGLRGIRLETAMCGGVRVTSAEALRRFFAALNDDRLPAKACQNIETKLDEIGI